MKITLQDFKTDDYLGRKHINGVMVTQELFEVDMLNRILVALCAERSADKVKGLIHHLWGDAKTSPLKDDADLKFATPVKRALDECIAANHPVLALSVLRLARIERLLVRQIERRLLTHDDYARAEKIVKEHVADDLVIALYGGGQLAEGSERRIFSLTAEEILKEEPNLYWPFGEFLNVPYAVEAGLLYTARLIIAKCYSVTALEKLYADRLLQDRALELSLQIARSLEKWRYAYLQRQIQFALIDLTGFIDGQHGLPEREASDHLHRDTQRMIAEMQQRA